MGRGNAYIKNSGEMAALFFFNHVVAWFGVPQTIVTDHCSHFHNHMMTKLTAKLGLSYDSSTLYYPRKMDKLKPSTKSLSECFNE